MNGQARATSVELTRDECLRLLRACSVGRVAVAPAVGSALVVPVNYIVDGENIVFRSDLGAKLGLLHERPVSFQIDWIDPFHHTGWSVLVRGNAFRATAGEAEHLDLDLDLRPWASGDKRHWVRVVPGEITGRRLVAPALTEGVVS